MRRSTVSLRPVSLRAGCVLALAATLAACGSAAAPERTGPGQLSVGSLPPGPATAPLDTSYLTSRTTVPIAADDRIGRRVAGNRVLAIGDSVMASTSSRYSGDMCEALVPLGWQVEVAAETGRFVDFGTRVLDRRLDIGWDVGVVLLGNNYRGDVDDFRREMTSIIDRFTPAPVVVLTVSEFTSSRVEVNQVILEIAAVRPDVLVVDWATVTAQDPSLTGSDRLHLTTEGRLALAREVALALGEAPSGPGDCLPSQFVDDSSGSVTGTTTTVASSSDPSPETTDRKPGNG